MLCKIADLFTEVPEAGGLAPRCREYLWDGPAEPDIIIKKEKYDPSFYPEGTDYEMIAYMESFRQFYSRLYRFDGFYLHASAVAMDGKAYLFSGPCGTGKSTHTRLWQRVFGQAAQVFNDDKPALRRMDGRWYAYGTPWCGKDGINQNKKIPLAGICFLKQGNHNAIRRLSKQEAVMNMLQQTLHRSARSEDIDCMLRQMDALLRETPVYELVNKPEPAAALLSYETMRRGAQEAAL